MPLDDCYIWVLVESPAYSISIGKQNHNALVSSRHVKLFGY